MLRIRTLDAHQQLAGQIPAVTFVSERAQAPSTANERSGVRVPRLARPQDQFGAVAGVELGENI